VYVAGEEALLYALFSQAKDDDTVDEYDSYSKTSSVVDDAFFISKKAINRSILSGDPNCACAVVNNVTNLIQADLREYLESAFGSSKRLFSFCIADGGETSCQAIFKHAREATTSGSPGKITSADSLPHALSNIALSWSYASKFKQDCLESFDAGFGNQAESRARSMFQQCLLAFDVCVNELNELHVACAKYILVQVRAMYISPHMSVIDSVDFDIAESEFADYQVNDPFMKAFIASLDALIKWIRAIVGQDSVRVFFILLSDYIAIRLERTLFQHTKSKFSILGATQLYQDVSRLVSFIASATEVPVRNKYGRLQELCSIMCVESVAEYLQIYGDSSATKQYKITVAEVKSLLAMRSDLSQESVATLS
jgi:conserved oligomeric Golgi complex subunit 4